MGRQYVAKDFINAIPGTGGIVSAIARKVGCEWETVRAWIDKHPTIKRAYDAECEAMLDLAESTVLKNIKDGDTQDAKWYLTKKGKKRGYGDAVEVTQDTKGTLTITHGIDATAAGTIFDFLATIGAIESGAGDSEDDEIHPAITDS